ncbi:unnamed protein product [Cuscuta europaea]|uniref:F-box domain-containing protein n=1 Tax=Cuscuta europaea TaxID=41803 RepID=A0A9P0VW89_CUSEU|nr:unnamed protein product [Cuscuta europaea]
METETSLAALPVDCLSNILSLTTPKQACSLSLVASFFRSAATSGAVWERFLPPDHLEIISQSPNTAGFLTSLSKRDLYFRLCDFPVLVDGDTKSFSLEKKSGKKCYMIAARALNIVWMDTPGYWQWISLPQSRFPEVAELLDVCWLEICGKINITLLSPNTNYAAYLVFVLQPRSYGFHHKLVDASIDIIGGYYGQVEKQTVYLSTQVEREAHPLVAPREFIRVPTQRVRQENMNAVAGEEKAARLPKKRSDEWMEVELGEFFVTDGEDRGDICVSLREVRGHWKRGLIIEGIEIRPKEETDK